MQFFSRIGVIIEERNNMKMIKVIFTGIAMISLTVNLDAQITISEYTRALKVDAYNIPAPDVTFTSSCGEVKVDITEKRASGGCLGNIIRSYSATDDCGNTAFAEQYLSLQDTKGPEFIGVPDDLTVKDFSEVKDPPVVSATDLGDQQIDVTMSITKESDRIIRTWHAEDKCGNKSEATQVITIQGS